MVNEPVSRVHPFKISILFYSQSWLEKRLNQDLGQNYTNLTKSEDSEVKQKISEA